MTTYHNMLSVVQISCLAKEGIQCTYTVHVALNGQAMTPMFHLKGPHIASFA